MNARHTGNEWPKARATWFLTPFALFNTIFASLYVPCSETNVPCSKSFVPCSKRIDPCSKRNARFPQFISQQFFGKSPTIEFIFRRIVSNSLLDTEKEKETKTNHPKRIVSKAKPD